MPRPPNSSANNPYRWALIGLGFGALYWILDTTVDALFFEEDSGFVQVLFPTGMELWVRGSVMVLAVALSSYAGLIIAKQNRTHEALRRSDERFRIIAENIPGVVYSFESHPDFPRRTIFIGPGMSTLIGKSAASDVRENVDSFFDLIHPDDRAALEQAGNLDKSSEQAIDQQYRLRTESGEYRWVRSVGQALRVDSGWTRWHGVLIDISEQKRTEQARRRAHDELERRVRERTAELSAATERATKELEQRKEVDLALRENERRFRQMAENIDEVLWLTDWQTKSLLYVNAAYETMFGRSCESLYQDRMSWTEVIHPEDRDRVAKAFARGAALGENAEEEYRIVRDDGSIRWLRDRAFPIRNRAGEIYRFVGVAEDITDRKQTDVALRRSEEQYRTLVEQATDGIFIVDDQGRFVEANSAGCTMLAYSQDELRQFTINDLLAEKDPQKRRPRLEEVRAGKAIVSERRYRRGDGQIIYMEVHAGMLPDGRILGIARDVTQRKKQERELQERSELEQLLFGELDHRIRNNLSSLITLIEMTSGTGEDVEEFADSIKHRILGMANVHSLLSQSHWRPITLRRLIEVLTTAEYPGTIAVQGSGVLISPRQTTGLGVVINELMINSLKHGALRSPQGQVEISWELQRPKETPLRLLLNWHEANGPAVASQPEPNVGSRIIQGIVRSELRGRAKMSYPPQGAHHRFVIALDTVEEMLDAEVVTETTLPERS